MKIIFEGEINVTVDDVYDYLENECCFEVGEPAAKDYQPTENDWLETAKYILSCENDIELKNLKIKEKDNE